MFIITLKFSTNKKRASEFIPDHNEWLKRGFDDGVFLMSGSLQNGLGGGIIAYKISIEELEKRVSEDPFVAQNIVSAEIIEIISCQN